MRIGIKDIAGIMGVTREFVRYGLRANKWDWGDAFSYKNTKNYTYRIYWPKFKEWWGEDEMTRKLDEEIERHEAEEKNG